MKRAIERALGAAAFFTLSASFLLAQDAALEEEFFETLARCDSPVLTERDEREEELTRRFVEFEPIWKERDFLTNGEICAEARQRFERAEVLWRRAAIDEARGSFRLEASVADVSRDADENERRTASFCVYFPENVAVVYLIPSWSDLFWRDEKDGSVWRPVSRNSAPELEPERGARSIGFEVELERVDETDARTDDDGLALEALVGVDVRPLTIRVAPDANAKTARVQSGALRLSETAIKSVEGGAATIATRVERDDAIGGVWDSHRTLVEKEDMALVWNDGERRAAPSRIATRARRGTGATIELRFGDVAEALKSEDLALEYRAPRFYSLEKIFLPLE